MMSYRCRFIANISTLPQCAPCINSIQFLHHRAKNVFHRFLRGFSVLDMLPTVRKYPQLQRALFSAPSVMNAANMKALFATVFTTESNSNRRCDECQRRAWFDDFLDLIQSGELNYV